MQRDDTNAIKWKETLKNGKKYKKQNNMQRDDTNGIKHKEFVKTI